MSANPRRISGTRNVAVACLSMLALLVATLVYSSHLGVHEDSRLQALRQIGAKIIGPRPPARGRKRTKEDEQFSDLNPWGIIAGKLHIGKDEVRILNSFPNIRWLDLSGADFHEVGLAFLGRFQSLEQLDLMWTTLSSNDLKSVAAIEQLGVLHLKHCKLDSSGLRHFSNFKSLYTLFLRGTEIDELGISALSEVESLRYLDLSQCKADPRSLDLLKSLRNLHTLVLDGTRVDDKSLDSFGAMPSLKVLVIRNTSVSNNAVERLQASNPSLRVIRE